MLWQNYRQVSASIDNGKQPEKRLFLKMVRGQGEVNNQLPPEEILRRCIVRAWLALFDQPTTDRTAIRYDE